MLRQIQLTTWLKQCYPAFSRLEFAASDAEYRRYFRLWLSDKSSLIVMDADPTKMSILPYIRVRQVFSMLNVPKIFHTDSKNGFMVLEDMGSTTYLTACLNRQDQSFFHQLLLTALDELITLQKASKPNILTVYDQQQLRNEAQWFVTWFCQHELKKTLQAHQQRIWDNTLAILLPKLTAQSYVFVHHDYMVRNIMLTNARPGILDFQDALYGPITYDLVSLLKDAFISWDETLISDLIVRYWETARDIGLKVPYTIDQFLEDFEWMSIQRHLKVIGVFSRLYHRDHKKQYQPEIQRFLNYLSQTTAHYPVFSPFHDLLYELTNCYAERFH